MVSLAHVQTCTVAAKAKHTLSPSGMDYLRLVFSEILFCSLIIICPTMIKLVEYGLQIVLLVLVLDLLLCFCILAGHRQDITVLRINNIELSPNLK